MSSSLRLRRSASGSPKVTATRAAGRHLTKIGDRLARGVERALPVRPEVSELFERVAPDVLMLTPLLYFGSQQPDYVRVARMREPH